MPFDVGDFVGGAAREAAEAFREPAGVVAGYYRDALRGLPDGPPIISLARGVAQQACRRYADNPDGMPGPIAAGFESVCRPYLDDIGYGSPATIDQPFEGGQCEVNYFVQYSYNTVNTDGSPGQTFTPEVGPILGPIRGIERRGSPGNYIAVITSGDGVESVVSSSSAPQGGLENLKIVQFFVAGGGSGPDCGDPPPVLVGPGTPAIPGPQTEPFSPSPGVNVDIDLTIGPTGDITFNIGTGPITISPFPGGGGGEDNPGIDQPGTAPSSGLPPGDIGAPAAPVETPPGGEASGCAPPNSVLVGIKINIVLAPEFASEYDPLVRRGVCYAYMGTIGSLALEPSGVALRSGQMLFAPLDNLTCWEVRANTGYVLQVIPYYRALELEEV